MSNPDLEISVQPPNPAYVAVVTSVIRGLLQIASGLGFGWGAFVSGDQVTMIAAAVVMVGTLLWSAYQKIHALRRAHNNAVQSAVQSADATSQAGQPVAIVVSNQKGTSS